MPLKHFQKLNLPDPALENATGTHSWENQRKTPQLMLSGATEVRWNARNTCCVRIYKMIHSLEDLN